MNEELEKLRKQRGQVRRLFTLTAKVVEGKLGEDDSEQLELEYKKLEDRAETLFELDAKVREIIFSVDSVSEKEIDEEYDKVADYRDRWISLKNTVERKLWPKEISVVKDVDVQSGSRASSYHKRLKYEKLKLRKYDGDIKEWIGFWSQFKRIHEDDELPMEDKFQYLLQCMKEGSKAHKFLERFPPSANNYQTAVDRLKRKFGREDLLKEIYVRELLKLVLNKGGKLGDLFDALEANLNTLESLGVTMKDYAFILYPLAESALPEEIWKVWERKRLAEENSEVRKEMSDEENEEQIGEKSVRPTSDLEKLLAFLRHEVECEDRMLLARNSFVKELKNENKEKDKFKIRQTPTAATLITTDSSGCLFCNKNSHKSYECFNADKLTLKEKRECLNRNRCCFICFKPGHTARFCRASVKCLICRRRHLTIMCPGTEKPKKKVDEIPGGERSSESSQEEVITGTLLSKNNRRSTTFLQTLLVRVMGQGKECILRVLLDSGSQRSYITKKCVTDLGLNKIKDETLAHSVFGGLETRPQSHGVYLVQLGSLKGSFTLEARLLDQEKICGTLPKLQDQKCIKLLEEKGIYLSDTKGDELEINLLLGADTIGKIMTGRLENISNNMIAVETRLGWAAMGKTEISYENTSITLLNRCEKIEDLWRLEILGIIDPAETKSQRLEEEEALSHFKATVNIDQNGRYLIELPWILGHRPLGSNRALAEKRLFSLTKRLRNIGKFKDYDEVFKKWKEDDIIETATDDKNGHYLPHHAVMKESSRTTKVRPVFDASAKDINGNSLNSCLFKGSNFVELIPSILLRFREHEIGVSSDIEKAFLQIVIKEKDRDFLRFLWWEKGELQVYRHKRVVFGVKCSPFLLGAVLWHFLERASEEFGDVVSKLNNSFYVDNCITSVRGKEELLQFMEQARELMATAGFNLRDWHYTDAEIQEEISVVGMVWDKGKDTLRCAEQNEDIEAPITRRKLLSIAHKIFDPVGFTGPATVIPKLLLQESWKLKLGWDAELPKEIQKRFRKWYKEVDYIWRCEIPRKMKSPDCELTDCTLHIFSDASKIAYGGCVFVRAVRGEEVTVQLLMAKVRITPLKQITIPRLELLGALVATRLFQTVKEALKLPNVPVRFWTDSTVVLAWIKRNENWNVFVANRIKEIKESTKEEDWYHVPGSLNPADFLSRGCMPKTLWESKWWEGPAWLREKPHRWPQSEASAPDEEVYDEIRKTAVSATLSCSKTFSEDRLGYFSSYFKLVRMVGWILRFKKIVKMKNSQLERRELLSEEFQEAERRVLKVVQEEGLNEKDMKKMHKFKDENGLWRIKTRLIEEESSEFHQPIILPSRHHIVEKLIMWEHKGNQKHAGLQTVMASLRERFWVIKARKTIKRVIGKCNKCQRFKSRAVEVPIAPLPKERTQCDAPFSTTGVDLAGPLYLKEGEKCWIALFTCAVYRAVHLELVRTLSTEDFISALRRFIARRGRIITIWSDNGTNFKGTSNALNNLDWEKIQTFATTRRIKWKFNPPTAAWWGGWWERLVRSVKDLLRKNLGNAVVTYDELLTLLCDCEAIINSRPLTYISDEETMQPLTPACFLQGLTSSDVTDLDEVDANSLKKRLRYLQKLRDCLRRRFRQEYLSLLVHNGKRSPTELEVGQVVLIEKENVKRVYWPLGVIEEIMPGRDGIPRVARLRTVAGEIVRPYQRLYLLEADQVRGKAPEDEVNDKPPAKKKEREVEVSQTPTEEVPKEGERRTRTRTIKVPARLDL